MLLINTLKRHLGLCLKQYHVYFVQVSPDSNERAILKPTDLMLSTEEPLRMK